MTKFQQETVILMTLAASAGVVREAFSGDNESCEKAEAAIDRLCRTLIGRGLGEPPKPKKPLAKMKGS